MKKKPTTNNPTSSGKGQQLENVGECLYREATSKIYYALFKRGGRQIKQSLKTTDKELAKRRLEPLRQKVVRLNTKDAGDLLFADLAKRWLETKAGALKPSSHERRRTSIASLEPHFKATVRSIGKLQVEEWATKRAKDASARTFNIDRETLIQILDYAASHGLILDNPARTIHRRKESRPPLVIPTKLQFTTLIDQLRAEPQAQEAADLCEFLAYGGCRLGEAIQVQWGDVNFDKKAFMVTGGETGTKNHEARSVPLFPSLERLLMEMRDGRLTPPETTDKLFSITKAEQAMNTACRNAKLPHFTHHSLRHFFCSNAIEAGIDFKVIAGWLGHKDGGVLVAKTYGHLRDEHSTLMAKRMTFDAASKPETPPPDPPK
ncbi:MAG: site-specific integrase [Verrucomicrobia bacterium]|nr:site-specific integrase [Verrucomicrobiota bacterium]